MENISYDALEEIGYKGYLLPKDAPEKVLQFGEGNFLRAFVDYAVDVANEENGFDGSVAVVMPRSGKTDRYSKQNDIYTVCLRGQQHGKVCKENRVITSVKTVISARDEYDAFMALAQEEALEFVVSKPASSVMPMINSKTARRRPSRLN